MHLIGVIEVFLTQFYFNSVSKRVLRQTLSHENEFFDHLHSESYLLSPLSSLMVNMGSVYTTEWFVSGASRGIPMMSYKKKQIHLDKKRSKGKKIWK